MPIYKVSSKSSGWVLAGLIALFIIAAIFTPLAIIWSINTLIPVLAIPYTFWSWLAIVCLNCTWLYKSPISKSKD